MKDLTKEERYRLLNNAEGKCCYCPGPLAPGSKRVCIYHRDCSRANARRKRQSSPQAWAAYMRSYRARKSSV